MDLGIRGRIAMVAGGSTGIGRAIADSLAAEGVNLAILARTKVTLDKSASEIKEKFGVEVLPIVCDVSNKKQIESAVKKVISKLGNISILICNAAGPPLKRFHQIDDLEWDSAYSLNLKSTIRLISAVLPGMKEQKWGRIISITSITALQASETLILSSTMRPGVHGLTKALSNDVAELGITVNVICPGYTATERLTELADAITKSTGKTSKQVYQMWKDNVPAKRLAQPSEIGDFAAFLASERAGYITGLAINVDGGFVKSI